MSPACPHTPIGTAADSSRRYRREHGLPDQRDREPLAIRGEHCWPAQGAAPADLLELSWWDDALTASARELDDLGVGVAIPGAPGTCLRCHHYKPWHRQSRRACELCDCQAFTKAAAA